MNWDLDSLLDMVDEWQFKLHDKLKGMTPRQREAFWREAREEARARGFTILEPGAAVPRRTKRPRRAAGQRITTDKDADRDELLDMVDQWKFKLQAKLKKMTPKQRA